MKPTATKTILKPIAAPKSVAVTLDIKPMSVNDCWQGRRFKTPAYKSYEKELLYRLPKMTMPEPPYYIIFEFGMSNIMSDWDNPVKPLQDILQTKYKFNDRRIMKATVDKIKVAKGKEYFTVQIIHID